MYAKILVPLDGSGRAERILPHVEQIALNFKSEVIFLRVIDPYAYLPGATSETPQSYVETFQNVQKEAQTYIQTLQGEYRQKGIKARTVLESGAVVPKILQVAETEDVDLIAMASHGRSGLARMVYGSAASGVLHSANRPLLLVRATA